MAKKVKQDKVKEFERALDHANAQVYVLRLFVSGASSQSLQAIDNLKRLCDEHFPEQYELQVIDIRRQPERAAEAQLLAVPTLIKDLPLPVRRLIGNLSNAKHALRGLDVPGEDVEK